MTKEIKFVQKRAYSQGTVSADVVGTTQSESDDVQGRGSRQGDTADV